MRDAITEQARRLHADALVWDMCVPWRFLPRLEASTDIGLKWGHAQALADNGVKFASLTVATDEETTADAAQGIAQEMARIRSRSDRFVLIETVDDIAAANQSGKLALTFNFQGTAPFARELGLVEAFYRLGVRQALLAYNQQNWVGSGCHEHPDGGLSGFGRRLVQEFNAVGMLVDLSHTGYRTSREAIEVAHLPVVFSHSNALALHNHQRNLPDDLIKACAETGGVIGVNGVGVFLNDRGEDDPNSIVDHIAYMADLVGIRHVGLGIDYMYDLDSVAHRVELFSDGYPAGGGYDSITSMKVLPPSGMLSLTEAMLRRGFSESDTRSVLGLNFLRVCREVWK